MNPILLAAARDTATGSKLTVQSALIPWPSEAERIAQELLKPIDGFDDPTYLETQAAEMLLKLQAENEALRRANLDCVDHFDALKVDYDALRVSNDKLTSELDAAMFRKGCKECTKEKQARADNKEWQDGVKQGNEIIAALAAKEMRRVHLDKD